ncbi:putative alpha-1,6-mannanase (GH76 family) [Labedella gwakjiensis]|nr:glycoside hydrolase family 76 protein [Labedella gwakjiensis]PSL37727.1 putative alpha-1,6-mannanase (GH76 family) [Labedella gwakjiensis]
MKKKIPLLAIAAITGAALVAPLQAPAPAAAFTSTQATEAFDDFLDVYWDDAADYFYTYSDHQIHAEHAHGPQGGLYTDYWWEAQLWEMVMDRYERTGDAQSRALIDDVFAGFQAQYPDFRENDWNDDIGWWARGSIRAYELTGDADYLAAAEEMFAFIAPYEDTTYGGGIWWKNIDVGDGTRNEKNVATNATAVYTAMRLYAATGDTTYRATAVRIYDWLDANFNNAGHLRDHVAGTGQYTDWDWTYNEGNFAGAALELWLDTGSAAYLSDATDAVDWAVANMTSSGTLLREGIDDTGGFKAILTRNIRHLVDEAGQTQYEQFLTDNATQAANHVNSAGIGGYDWTAPTPELSSTALQSLAAAATVAVLQQASPDGYTGVIEGSGVYEAENAVRNGVDSESTAAGKSGRGYLAGWNTSGTSVVFHVNVVDGGTYTVDLRYAAGAGDATRSVIVDGGSATSVSFPGTSGWDQWASVPTTVTLTPGHNTITVSYDTGSSNYLNLDRLTLAL